jgi:glucokinase
MATHVLGGDIGGTKTALGVYEITGGGKLRPVAERRFRSREHQGLEAIIEEFLNDCGLSIDAAAFGVAGPVFEQVVEVTNLPWRVERDVLARLLQTPRVHLMNDLAATAYGALFLSDSELHVLNAGEERKGNAAVIAAGTGLGQALLIWNGSRHLPCGTEGGHADFAPRNHTELKLLDFLLEEFDRVSFERVLSGGGLHNILRFVDKVLKVPVAAETRKRLESEDPGKVIGEQGVDGACEACSQTIDIFLDIYGAQAGNLALTTMAVGGVYVAGGPAIKLLPRIKEGGFMGAFVAKGRFEELMNSIPLRIILNPETCQLGAAHAASNLLDS